MSSVRDVELRHLAALRAVAEEGTFGRAAQRLGFSQAAISQQIAALERVIGEPVFDRPGGPRPVEITPAGRVVLAHAEAILERLVEADDELQRLRAGTGGRLMVGTFQSVSVKLLPAVVGALRAESPALDIRLHETDDNDELHQLLVDDRLDLSFLVGPVVDDRLDIVPVCVDQFVLIAAAGTLPPGKVRPADVAGHPLIGQTDCSCQRLIDDGLRELGVEPGYVFRSNDNGAVQAMVRAGMGVAVMPLLAIDAHDPGIDVRPIKPGLEPRQIVLGLRQGRTRPPVAARFVELALGSAATAESSVP